MMLQYYHVVFEKNVRLRSLVRFSIEDSLMVVTLLKLLVSCLHSKALLVAALVISRETVEAES